MIEAATTNAAATAMRSARREDEGEFGGHLCVRASGMPLTAAPERGGAEALTPA